MNVKKKEIEWERINDPEYLASVVGGEVISAEEREYEKKLLENCFALDTNFGDNALITHHKDTFGKCIEISRAKCADYAGDSDPLANFRMCEILAGVPMEKGIMVRLSDKISRIGRLLDNENKVADEKIEDTILDGINYLSILYYALKDKRDRPERYEFKKIEVKAE